MKTNRKINRKTRQNTLRILGIVSFCVLFSFSGSGFAQTGGAQLYPGYGAATSSSGYGSIGYGSSGAGSISPSSSLGTDFSSSYSPLLAQSPSFSSSSPAPIAPIQSSTPPSIPSTSSIFMQPIDPYAVSNQSSLFSGGFPIGTASTNTGYNNKPSGIYSGNIHNFVPETYDAIRRFREATSAEFTYLPGGNKAESFGLTELDLRLQLAFPCRFIPNNGKGSSGPGYFYIAPGGSLVWWDGPFGPPNHKYDMPPNGFGAFLDVGVQPQFNDVFALDAWFRVGIYSDFKKVSSDCFRFQGRLAGLFTVSPKLKIVAGVLVLDRERIKLLPTGGVVWTPQDDWILRLTFPNPKISKRLWNTGRATWWAYVQGEYGGGSWGINGIGQTDYNDIRVGIGLEFDTLSKVNGYFEFGGSFDRELYSKGERWARPDNVIYIKTGFVF